VRLSTPPILALAGVLLAGAVRAEAPTPVEELEVTATKVPEAAEEVPAYISIIKGEDLRARRINDLRTALTLVAGVEAPPGGDAGPASAVPSFWGLHEFDAFLLVVDGVPLGGAFNPGIPALNLNDVERIEVLKGSAPVVYGATAFVGVIQVIHYPAGQSAQQAEAGYGTHNSWHASGSLGVVGPGGVSQSIAVDAHREGFSDPRAKVSGADILYRATAPVAGGTLRFDLDLAATRSVPRSPVIRDGASLTTLTPLDANYNPTDAKIDQDYYQRVLAYSRATPLGLWETTASLAWYDITDIRGFLRPDLSVPTADSQNQSRQIVDDYFDTHLNNALGKTANLTIGADLLYGRGSQTSRNGGYFPSLDGSTPLPSTAELHVDEINSVFDKRTFVGQYAQLDWKPVPRLDINGGIRLNETWERKQSRHIDGFDPTADTYDERTQQVTRPSGMVGLSYKAWQQGADELVLFGDFRDTFKPAAIDFGPDNTPDILKPETARSYELGAKGRLAGGRVTYEAGLFLLDFSNLVVATTDANGDNLLQNAGGEHLKGLEIEAGWQVTPDLTLNGAFSYHDARFTHYVAAEGGTNIDVSGNRLTLSPSVLASAGVVYSPPKGIFGSITGAYFGERYLDLANTALVGAYATVDATVGYRLGRYSLAVSGYNLGDQRPPVTQSEFGDQSYYLLPGRSVIVSVRAYY
jgi:iron complex outermembrane recepter protein